MNGSVREMICGEFRFIITGDRAGLLKYLGPEALKVQPIDAGKRVTVPETADGVPVKWICKDAFRGCGQMEEVRIPQGIGGIGARAFMGCSRLITVKLPAGLQFIEEEAFRDCARMEQILPEMLLSLKQIGEGAFRGCRMMKGIFLTKNVEKIGPRAFRGCDSLTITVTEGSAAEDWCRKNPVRYVILGQDGKITVPDRPDILTVEEEYGFAEKEDGTLRITRYNGKREKFSVPAEIGGKAVTEIGDYAFCGYEKVKRLALPDGVTRIGNQAFDGCRCLDEIKTGDRLREIGDEAFINCYGLEKIEGSFPVLQRIGSKAFRRCDRLKGMTFSAALREIGKHAFEHTALESFSVPGGTLTVGEYAFEDCFDLKEVRLPEGLQKLGHGAFRNCTKLERIEIPSADFEIGTAVFENCIGLKEIRLGTHERLTMAGRFLADGEKKRVIAYCTGWEDELCAVPRGTEIIGKRAVMRAKMERAILPEGVRIIENEAFYGCERLKTVQLPESLRVIGHGAFGSCQHLKWLTIPDGVEEIGGWAFRSCPELNRLRIPPSVKKIEPDLFGWSSHKPVCIVTKGSCAEQYCLENQLETEYE